MDHQNRSQAIRAILHDPAAMEIMTAAVEAELADFRDRGMWLGLYRNGLAIREPGDEVHGCVIRFGTADAVHFALDALIDTDPGWAEIASEIMNSPVLLELMRKAVEDQLVILRDSGSWLGGDDRGGFVIGDRDSGRSSVIRISTEDGLRIALDALAEASPQLIDAMQADYDAFVQEQAGSGEPG